MDLVELFFCFSIPCPLGSRVFCPVWGDIADLLEAVVEVEDDQDDEVHGEGVHVEGEGVIQGEGMRPCED